MALPVVAFRGSLFQILKEDEYYYRERTLTMQECLTLHLSSLYYIFPTNLCCTQIHIVRFHTPTAINRFFKIFDFRLETKISVLRRQS